MQSIKCFRDFQELTNFKKIMNLFSLKFLPKLHNTLYLQKIGDPNFVKSGPDLTYLTVNQVLSMALLPLASIKISGSRVESRVVSWFAWRDWLQQIARRFIVEDDSGSERSHAFPGSEKSIAKRFTASEAREPSSNR